MLPRVMGARSLAEKVKVDYHYGHEKFAKDSEDEYEADPSRPKAKGAKLAGVQGGSKTRRWYKQVTVGTIMIKPELLFELHSLPPTQPEHLDQVSEMAVGHRSWTVV
jgi:hypothetical protein